MICFPANPLVCDGTDAAVSLHKVPQFHVNSTHESELSSCVHRSCDSTSKSRTIQPSPAALPRRRQPLVSARHFINARRTDETSRSESGDPVCRPIRGFFAVPALVSPGLRGQTSRKRSSGRSRRRGTIVSGRFRARKLVGSGRYSKCFFAGVQCFADHDPARLDVTLFWRRARAAYPSRSVRGRRGRKARCANKRRRRRLAGAEFDDQSAARRQAAPGIVGGDRAIAVEPIGPAVERRARIEVAHLGRKRRDLGGRDIGRIGDDEIERSARVRVPRSQATKCGAVQAANAGHCARATASAPTLDVGADAERVAAVRESSASRSAPDPVPRSAMRRARAREPCAIDRRERRLDHGFGFRPRHQRRGVDAQRQAPEFLAADDARDRLAREPPLRPARRLRRLLAASSDACAGRRERRVIERRARDRSARARRVRANRCRRRGISSPDAGARPTIGAQLSSAARRSSGDIEPPASSRVLGGEQRGLMLGDQRVDDLAQRLALQDLRQLVEREIDAVVATRGPAGNCRCGCARSGRRCRPGRGVRRRARRPASGARSRRAACAAPPSPWRGCDAASGPPASSRRCRWGYA